MLHSCIMFAQDCNYRLTGTIEDFHDGTPIVGATIYMKNLDTYTTSNIDGYFSIDDLCKGKLILEISHIGCETKLLEIDVTGDMVRIIKLEHHIEELGEVKVNGKGQLKQTATGQESKIKSEVLSNYSALTLGDVVKEISGVQSLNTGNVITKPIINGLHSSRVAIINNGVRLQDQDWGIEHAPNLDINASSSISVIKGSSALALSGDAIGGVVVLNPKRAIRKDSLYGQTTLNGQSNGRGGSVSTKLGKSFKSGWYVDGIATYKRLGDFEAPDYVLSNSGTEFRSFSINGGFSSFEKGFNAFYSVVDNTIGILSASHLGSIQDLVNAINSDRPLIIRDFTYDILAPRQEITHHMAKAEFYKRFSSFGKITLNYNYQNNQRFEFDRRRGDDRDKAAVDLKLQTHNLRLDVQLDKTIKWISNFGVSLGYQDNFANPETGVRRLIPDYERYDFGIYGLLKHQLNDNWLLDAGVRYDFNRIDAKKFYLTSRWEERGYDEDFSDIIIEDFGTQLLTNPQFNYHNISASLGAKYDWNESNSVLFNASISSRAPNPSELFSDGLHHSAARFELGDLRFDQERSYRLGVSYKYDVEATQLLIEGFINRINGFLYLEPIGTNETTRGPFPEWAYMQTNALMYGVDFTFSHTFNESFSYTNKSSILFGRDTQLERPLIDIPPARTENSIRFSKVSWNDFSAGITSELVAKQNNFPNNDFEAFLPLEGENVLVEISETPDAYHLLHFDAQMKFSFSKRLGMKVRLGIDNILDTSYRNLLNRQRFFADELGRNVNLQIQLNY